MDTRIALSTGGSRGLGKSTALHLAAKGVDVILTYRTRREEAEDVVAETRRFGRRAVALPLDAGKVAEFRQFAKAVEAVLATEWQRRQFDFLVNNAGIGIADWARR